MAAMVNMSRKRKHEQERQEIEEEEDDVLIMMSAVWFLMIRRHRKTERTLWTRNWLLRREDLGAYHTLLQELKQEDRNSFLNFLRMSPGIFASLLTKVSPKIKRKITSFRKPISPGMRLAITLRFLATGNEVNYFINT